MPDFFNSLEILSSEIIGISFRILLIIIINFLLYKILIAVIKRLFKKSKNIRSDTLITLIANTIRYIFYFFVIAQVLDVFGVSVMSILAVAGVSSIAIGFGAQNLVKDIISGVFILFEDQFNIGDIISIGDKTGTVEAIGIRVTRLRGFDGFVHIIPNGEIKIVTNMTKEYARAIVDIQISYSDDTNKAIEIIKDEAETVTGILPFILETPAVLGISTIDDGLITIRINAKCEMGKNFEAERELRRIIKNRLEKEGFNPPYKRVLVEQVQRD